jgi:protease-4
MPDVRVSDRCAVFIFTSLHRKAAVYSAISGADHTAVVRVHGVIAEDQEASANVVVTGLRKAFESKHTKAVLLVINSPGGSPVQSNYIYDEIKRLRQIPCDSFVCSDR